MCVFFFFFFILTKKIKLLAETLIFFMLHFCKNISVMIGRL